MQVFFSLCNSIQQSLIPFIEDNLFPPTKKEKAFVRVAELAAIDKQMGPYKGKGNGRKPSNRKAIAFAFFAKAVWNLPTTRMLIEYLKTNQTVRRLCGWERIGDIPSESTFSRVFSEFSKGQLASLVQESIMKRYKKVDSVDYFIYCMIIFNHGYSISSGSGESAS